jgi:hypothetical protein
MNQSKQKNVSLIIFSIFIYIAIVAILGLFQIFVFDTDWSEVRTANFWIEQGITSAMYFSAYLATAILRYTFLELREAEYNFLNGSIQKNRSKLIGNRFRTYINDIDFGNKKDTWKNKFQAKLENLLRKVPKKVAKELTQLPEDKWGWRTKRYKKKEDKFMLFLSDEWIENNLRFRRLKYPEITVSEIINGTMKYKAKRSMLNRNHLGKQIFSKLIFVFASMIASAIWSILVFKDIINPLTIIGMIIFTLAMLLSNILTGWFAGGVAHKSRIVATTERLEIIFNFLDIPVPKMELENKEKDNQ